MSEAFEKWKKEKFPYHYYEPMWSGLMFAEEIESAFNAGVDAAPLPPEVQAVMDAAEEHLRSKHVYIEYAFATRALHKAVKAAKEVTS